MRIKTSTVATVLTIGGMAIAIPFTMVQGAQHAQHHAQQAAQPTCTELAVWPHVVATHGVEQAAAMWSDLVAQGWTNTRNGDPAYLVQPGCADAWS
jgi:hypothetical protein